MQLPKVKRQDLPGQRKVLQHPVLFPQVLEIPDDDSLCASTIALGSPWAEDLLFRCLQSMLHDQNILKTIYIYIYYYNDNPGLIDP